jgi:hypothetical protein
MARCQYPIPDTKSTGRKKLCDTRGRIDIVFQGKKIKVCNFHKSKNGE